MEMYSESMSLESMSYYQRQKNVSVKKSHHICMSTVKANTY